MTGIIDIHAHILPGIDDGSRDWDESRRMLEESYRQGIRYIIATPHYSRRGLNPDIYDLSEKLKEEARRIAPDFRTGLGHIITMDWLRILGMEKPLPWKGASMYWWNLTLRYLT